MNAKTILKKISVIGLYIAAATLGAPAQLTGGGTTNSLPKFSGSATLTNSSVVEVNGNVGIGTANPLVNLDINGIVRVAGSTTPTVTSQGGYLGWNALTGDTGETDFINNQGYGTGGFAFFNTPPSGSPKTTLMFLTGSGNLGVGTTTPNYPLTFGHNSSFNQNFTGSDSVLSTIAFQNNYGGLFTNATVAAVQPPGYYGDAAALTFSTAIGGLNERMRILPEGLVGIGTKTPSALLEVAGTVKLSGGGSFITFSDGSVQSVAWTGSLCGGDYAESVDVSGSRTDYEPGDVLVLDPAHPGSFLKSNRRYSRLVAGIYSTKPGVVGRRQATDPKLSVSEVPMAMVGIVPTKVTSENGPIEVGDLLVSSSLPAHAMKGSDDSMKTGTVIGKALGSLSTGTGVIEVLVSLQ
ncbi:MAG: hypothetical protein JWM43_456 [Acidobacteriaceae bacterium]|nr:hypothetical protein [Acidobacteriaceae bacterium]